MIQDEVIEGGVMVYATAGGSCTAGSRCGRFDGHDGRVDGGALHRHQPVLVLGPDPVLNHRGEHLGLFGDVE